MSVNPAPHVHSVIMVANIFVKRGDKLLVIKRSPDKDYLPNFVQPVGGKVNINEGPLQAAIRELQEEALIRVKNIRLEAITTDIHKKGIHNWQAFYFSGDFEEGEVPVAIDEGELLWLTPAEIKAQRVLDSIIRIVDNISDPKHGILFAEYKWDENYNAILKTLANTL